MKCNSSKNFFYLLLHVIYEYFLTLYVKRDLVLYEPTCALQDNITLSCTLCYIIPYSTHRQAHMFSTRSSCYIHQNNLILNCFWFPDFPTFAALVGRVVQSELGPCTKLYFIQQHELVLLNIFKKHQLKEQLTDFRCTFSAISAKLLQFFNSWSLREMVKTPSKSTK